MKHIFKNFKKIIIKLDHLCADITVDYLYKIMPWVCKQMWKVGGNPMPKFLEQLAYKWHLKKLGWIRSIQERIYSETLKGAMHNPLGNHSRKEKHENPRERKIKLRVENPKDKKDDLKTNPAKDNTKSLKEMKVKQGARNQKDRKFLDWAKDRH